MIRNLNIPLIAQYKINPITVLIALVVLALSAGCTNPEKQSNKSLIPEMERLGSRGFLPMDALPDSVALLPPPPAEGSVAYELDKEINRNSFSLRGSPRWEMAAKHLNDLIPDSIDAFYCSLDAQITEDETPYLYALLFRAFDDISF